MVFSFLPFLLPKSSPGPSLTSGRFYSISWQSIESDNCEGLKVTKPPGLFSIRQPSGPPGWVFKPQIEPRRAGDYWLNYLRLRRRLATFHPHSSEATLSLFFSIGTYPKCCVLDWRPVTEPNVACFLKIFVFVESWARKYPLLMITTTTTTKTSNDVPKAISIAMISISFTAKRPCYINLMFDDRMPCGSWRFHRKHWPSKVMEFLRCFRNWAGLFWMEFSRKILFYGFTSCLFVNKYPKSSIENEAVHSKYYVHSNAVPFVLSRYTFLSADGTFF